jgi:uncharacterized protein YegL
MTRPLVSPDVLDAVARPLSVAVIFDWSWTMRDHEEQIAQALRDLPEEFGRRAVLRNSAEIALITMGVPQTETGGENQVRLRTGRPDEPPFGFRRLSQFTPPPEVVCDGVTELSVALNLAVDLVERRCAQVSQSGRAFYSPYVAIISDGLATDGDGAPDLDAWRAAAARAGTCLRGRLAIEAFVPQGTSHGVLPDIITAGKQVLDFAPRDFATVLEAVSFSAEQTATHDPAAIVRKDLEEGQGP